MSPAERLLATACARTTSQTYGSASSDAALVSYCRVDRRYDVGTAAESFRIGYRAEVLPYLTALLAGCVTRESAEAWIERERAGKTETKGS